MLASRTGFKTKDIFLLRIENSCMLFTNEFRKNIWTRARTCVINRQAELKDVESGGTLLAVLCDVRDEA